MNFLLKLFLVVAKFALKKWKHADLALDLLVVLGKHLLKEVNLFRQFLMFLIALVELALGLIGCSQDLALLRLKFLSDFCSNNYVLNGLICLSLGFF